MQFPGLLIAALFAQHVLDHLFPFGLGGTYLPMIGLPIIELLLLLDLFLLLSVQLFQLFDIITGRKGKATDGVSQFTGFYGCDIEMMLFVL